MSDQLFLRNVYYVHIYKTHWSKIAASYGLMVGQCHL